MANIATNGFFMSCHLLRLWKADTCERLSVSTEAVDTGRQAAEMYAAQKGCAEEKVPTFAEDGLTSLEFQSAGILL